MSLSQQQLAILQLIHKRLESRKPPSFREIAEGVGLKSLSSIAYQLRRLEQLGYINRTARLSRMIRLNPRALELLNSKGRVSLLGQIAAGNPILARENIEESFTLPEKLFGPEKLYLLKVRGESMRDAGILNGDLVVIRPQNTAKNGQIVAGMIEEEVTVKTWKKTQDSAWLLPANPKFEPIPAHKAQILGVVVGVIRPAERLP